MNFLEHVASIIEHSERPIDEYELITRLKDQQTFIAIEKSCQQQPQLLLFRKHFTVMNALYQLQPIFWQQQQHLNISALEIFLQPVKKELNTTNINVNCDSGLRDYYLNWENYLSTGEAEVSALLSDFWIKYSKLDKRQAALELFELPSHATSRDITQRYRQLMSTHHPDKGGNSEMFIQYREAWEILK